MVRDAPDQSSDLLPFYVVKNRPSIARRRSSVQSFNQRHKFRLVRRLVRKSGKSSIHQKTTRERSFRFLLDISNTLIESSWVWTLMVVSFIFILTWVMFAGFWAIISLDNVELSNGTTDNCLEGIQSFSGFLLFSIETQTTIGYGGRYINEYCPEAIIGLIIQLVIGAGVCGSLICIVFMKMISPMKNPHSLVCFSKKAVICHRDGEMCLLFRVRDYDRKYECHTNIIAYLAEEKAGELSLKMLKLEKPGILIWPVEVLHKIDEVSPLYDLSAKDLILKRFEIIVVLEGESLATSYMSRTTTSYLSRELKWGHVFSPCTRWDKCQRKYIVDHKQFNKTVEVTIPLCSAQRLNEVYDDIVYHVRSSYTESVLSSKISSPSTLSPVMTTPKYYRKSDLPDELQEEPDDVRGVDLMQEEASSSSDGDQEKEYSTFMDLSVEDLAERRRRRRKIKEEEVQIRTSSGSRESRGKTFSGSAKEWFVNLQKYVSDSSAGKGRKSRKYEETDF